MSDFKDSAISELTLLAGASIASDDIMLIVDVSSTAAGETKRTTMADLIIAVSSGLGNITTQGNTFNAANKLVQLDSSGRLPAISGNLLVSLNADNFTGGTLADARLSANVTVQGNTFNAASKLVQLDSSNRYPAINGSLITNLNASAINSGTLPDAQLSANVALKTKLLVLLSTAGVNQLADLNRDAIYVVSHSSGVVNFNLPNTPTVSAGVPFTIVTNTTQAITFTCDTLATAYYINQAGTSVTIAPGATFSPANQRGRVISVLCVGASTYVISGSGL